MQGSLLHVIIVANCAKCEGCFKCSVLTQYPRKKVVLSVLELFGCNIKYVLHFPEARLLTKAQ